MRIHHISTDLVNRLPWEEFHWKKKVDPIFPEDAPILNELIKNSNNWEEN